MRVAIAGAHGKIGLRLGGLLAARGDAVTGLVRNPDHAPELEAFGIRPVVCDLESAEVPRIAEAVGDADAVVFAAGAGAGSGAERKTTMDRDGAIKLLHASDGARYVMVSSVGAEDPPEDGDIFGAYLRAKAEADAAVSDSDRAWSILRPGPLEDSPGTGRVRLSIRPFRAAVSRDDVALVLCELVDGAADDRILYVGAGETPIESALAEARERSDHA